MTLTKPNHPLTFGYYFVDTPQYGQGFPTVDSIYRGTPNVPLYNNTTGKIVFKKIINNNKVLPIPYRAADFWPEVRDHVNTYMAMGRGYTEGHSALAGDAHKLWEGLWIERMMAGCLRAVADGKKIHWLVSISDLGITGALPKCLYFFKKYDLWRHIRVIDLEDEPSWTYTMANSRKLQVKKKAALAGLVGMPPVGVTIADNLINAVGPGSLNEMLKSNLDFISIEAYLPPAIYGTSIEAVCVAALSAKLDSIKHRVKAKGKKILLVPQSYDRNGAWKNIDTLPSLQYTAYNAAKDDPSVLGLIPFNWARGGISAGTPTWGARPLPPWMPLDPTNSIWRPGMSDANKEIGAAILS
jgi:hypothetical protein